MKKFFRNIGLVMILMLLSLIVGMIAPGKWLTERQKDVKLFYYRGVRFRDTPLAENFTTNPFELNIVYLENTEGKLETYLVNAPKNEMLPVFEVEGTTQVGDVAHRFKGLGEEGRSKLQDILESVKDGSSGALDKALRLLGD